MGKLVGLLSAGVGLVAEAVAHNSDRSSQTEDSSTAPSTPFETPHRARPSQSRQDRRFYQEDPPSYSEFQAVNENQPSKSSQDCAYDDDSKSVYRGTDRVVDGRYSGITDSTGAQWSYASPRANNVDLGNQSWDEYESIGPLPLPVIIPQRRPEKKDRGWMLAYSPHLGACGITSDTFIEFLIGFNKACQASPALDAINLAAFGVGIAPGVIPMVVSLAVPAAVRFAKTAQTKTQASSYLAKMNANLFEPRGLIAMVTTFNQMKTSPMVRYGISSPSSQCQETMSSTARFELPPSAPLIYAEDGLRQEEKAGRGKRMGDFVANYYDRRAQYQYAQKSPGYLGANSPLPQFASRWSDPANGGSLISLVSGGLIQRSSSRDAKKNHHRNRRSSSSSGSSSDSKREKNRDNPGFTGSDKGSIAGPEIRQRGKVKGEKQRMGREDLLYLMIVNIDEARTMS